MLDCQDCIKEISNYLDGTMDDELRTQLKDHLRSCMHCKVVFDTTRKTIELYCDGKLFPLPADVRDRLHLALRKKRESLQS